jgi:hypothetical protein
MSTVGDHDHEEDVFNPSTPRVRVRSPSPRQFDGGLATPEHTPPRASQSQQSLAPSQEMIDRSAELLKDLQRQEQENVEKVCVLFFPQRKIKF